METEIEKACRLADGQSKLAERLAAAGKKVSPQAVHKWIKAGRVPPDKAVLIEQLLGGRVRAEQLCPDFDWPPRGVAARSARLPCAAGADGI
jgi:DNA-binding transcriptional regulator YdaS (Cro superfamily)